MLISFTVPTPSDREISGEEWTRRFTDQRRRAGEVLEDEVAFFNGL